MQSSRDTFSRLGLRFAGIVVLLIGIAHFFFPTYGYDPSVPKSMDPALRAHFFYLGTYAIGGFLVAFGAMSLAVAGLRHMFVAGGFSAIMALVWGWRTVLEIRYPVDLKLFFIERPTIVLLPTFIGLTAIYAAAAVAILRTSRWEQSDH